MIQLNETALVLAVPLMGMFVLVALQIRRHGAVRWIGAVGSSWLAGMVDLLGPDYQPIAVGLGALASMLFLMGARSYAGLAHSVRSSLLSGLIPGACAAMTAVAGPRWGYAAVAVVDSAAIVLAAHWTWPRGELETLRTARLLPYAFLAFLPTTLYYQLSRFLGRGPELATLVIATGMILVCIVILIVLTARIVREETLLRQTLEARLVEREGELAESRHRARSAERLAAVGTLAAGIAHQINNPVGAILSAAQFELSERSSGPAVDQDLVRTLRTIEREALRCARIVRNVVLFARTDPGKAADHDLREIVDAAIAGVAVTALERRAKIEVDGGRNALAVRGNAIELEQVFVNLIRNAIESRATDARVQISLDSSSTHAVVTIRDDGAGIRPEDRGRLFEPFFTTKLREGGSGLGLSVAHGIVRAHQGTIELLSSECGGAVFQVRLPRRPIP